MMDDGNGAPLLARLEESAQRLQLEWQLDVYDRATLHTVAEALAAYLARPEQEGRSWLPWRRPREPQRVAPLLLAGPVGTGKTTLMMLLDRALPEASCAPLFQQEIAAHPSARDSAGTPLQIEVHPLPLMGRTRNMPTGVLRLRELQTFHRRFTYDRDVAREDPEAAVRFAQLFAGRIVFVDEFVPDVVSSFPMQVINFLADHGVQVVLSSNRRETPFVEGVRVIAVEGEDMRRGRLGRVLLPAGPEPRFDAFEGVPVRAFERIARGLRGRLRTVGGQRWLRLEFAEVARAASDWLAFQQLTQETEVLLVDGVPLFDPTQEVGPDGARRFVLLLDALYDARRPVLLRLTNPEPLPESFEAEQMAAHYLPEIVVDLERALSRLRQLSNVLERGTFGGGQNERRTGKGDHRT